jgi:hypothetical protein
MANVWAEVAVPRQGQRAVVRLNLTAACNWGTTRGGPGERGGGNENPARVIVSKCLARG